MMAPCGIEIKVGQVWRWIGSKRLAVVAYIAFDSVVNLRYANMAIIMG